MKNPERHRLESDPITPEWADEVTPVCSECCEQYQDITGVNEAGVERTVRWCAISLLTTDVCLPAVMRGRTYNPELECTWGSF